MIYAQKYFYCLSSQKKLAIVAKLIAGKSYDNALQMLHFMPYKAAITVSKVLRTAYNNAKQSNPELSTSECKVLRYDLWPGPKLKRMRAVWRSRMHWYTKQRSSLVLYISTL
jgi:large subunit ribosomal protein L22